MLTPEELGMMPDRVAFLVAQVESRLLVDIARRIGKMGKITDTAQWQLEKLREINAQQEYVLNEIRKLTGLTEQELISLFDEAAQKTLKRDDRLYLLAGYQPIPLKDNKALQQVIMAGLRKTNNTFRNLTRTTALATAQIFESALDRAYNDLILGGFSYQEVIKKTIKELMKKGIGVIDYPTGHRDTIETATRRAILTGINQTAGEVQLQRMEEMGVDILETTAHAGARPSHSEWQGKRFSRSGNSKEYPPFEESTGYGTGPGLCGWNCRHNFFPVVDGLAPSAYKEYQLSQLDKTKVWYNGKELPLYEAQQKQRYYERQIRKWKEQRDGLYAAGIENEKEYSKVKEWQATQRDFIKQTGLDRDYFRERGGKQLSS